MKADRPRPEPRDTVRRPTTMAAAFADMLEKSGHDLSGVRMPTRREPSWRVTRRA